MKSIFYRRDQAGGRAVGSAPQGRGKKMNQEIWISKKMQDVVAEWAENRSISYGAAERQFLSCVRIIAKRARVSVQSVVDRFDEIEGAEFMAMIDGIRNL